MPRIEKRRFKTELYDQFARISKALASGRRLELIDLLMQSERTVESLALETAQSVANTSQHLQHLRRARLVETKRAGNHIYYRLADAGVVRLWLALCQLGESRLGEIGSLVGSFLSDRAKLQPMTSQELRRRLKEHRVVVIDVRPEAEYAAGHISGARSMPMNELKRRLRELPKTREVVVYCRGPYCVFADEAVALLHSHGYKAIRLESGFPDWAARGLPIATASRQ